MGWEFRFFTKHSELWKIKTFVSCEKKLEIFCYEILFRENLDIFSKNCLSTNRTPFYQTKSKVFVKHQNVLLKSTKIVFLQFENGCKSQWFFCAESIHTFRRAHT